MKNSTPRKLLPLIIVFIMTIGMITFVAPQTVMAAGTTYYVDSAGGNDSNNGTSTTTAWKTLAKVNGTTFTAGDTILFKKGCAWTGQLYPKGSGASGSPIKISSYGTGAKPIINGAGVTPAAVYLYNQQYWEISDLEVTNDNPGTTGLDINCTVKRLGVFILVDNMPTCNHLYIKNMDVHDIEGSITAPGLSCGIAVQAIHNTYWTIFDDVQIQSNTIDNVNKSGIYVHPDYDPNGRNGDSNWHPSTNVIVSSNTVNNVAGDGIVVGNCRSPILEYNVVSNAQARCGEGYCDVAIWTFYSDDALMQYNEAYLTHGHNDGEAFDVDLCNKRAIVQYNYSHNNEGGFMATNSSVTVPGSFCDNTIVRYNISQNDQYGIFRFNGNVTNTTIYNNTIYIGSGLSTNICDYNFFGGGDYPNFTYMYNNIIYNLGSGGYNFRSSTGNCFDHNVFYGNHPGSEPADVHKITLNPRLANPGSGGTGRTTVGGYMLNANSPCIDAGLYISNNGGKDYWGNTAPYGGKLTDIGACEYQGTVSTFAWEAENLGHSIGRADGIGWSANVNQDINEGCMVYGPYAENVGTGINFTVTFRMMIDDVTYNNANVVRLEAYDYTSNTILASRNITRQQFTAPYQYQDFTLSYNQPASGHKMEYRVYWYRAAYTNVDKITVNKATWTAAAPVTYEAEGTSLGHNIGRADGIGWSANVAQDNTHFLIYGPYATTIPLGSNREVVFRMMIDNNLTNNVNVLELQVYDATSGAMLSAKTVTRLQFNSGGQYQDFPLTFDNWYSGHQLEFRVYWQDTAYINVDKITVTR